MSSFFTTLSEKFPVHEANDLDQVIIEHFNQSSRPFDELLEYLLTLCETNVHNSQTGLINYLIRSFLQWKAQVPSAITVPKPDLEVLNRLVSELLPIVSVKEFVQLFQLSREYVIDLVRPSLTFPMNSHNYKRALNILVQLDYQLQFKPREILLPLIVNSKDHLIDTYLNRKPEYQDYLIQLLDHLYQNGGKKLKEILSNEYEMKNVVFNKKTLSKLAVRYWNLYGGDQVEKYPNLAILQNKRTLGYLINLKYSGLNEERTMSDECWNELVAVRYKELINSSCWSFSFHSGCGERRCLSRRVPHWSADWQRWFSRSEVLG